MSTKEYNYIANTDHDQAIAKGGVACPFPWRVHEMLKVTAEEGNQHIVSWAPHGRAFTVHKPQLFAMEIMPRFFSQTKYPSFQRQLNIYGFSRFTGGRDKGAYFHLCFVRGNRPLVTGMVRRKIKGNKVRQANVVEHNFYHPAWKNHFEASVPPALRRRTVSAAPKRGNAKNKPDRLPAPALRPMVNQTPDRLASSHVSDSEEDHSSASPEVSLEDNSLAGDIFENLDIDLLDFDLEPDDIQDFFSMDPIHALSCDSFTFPIKIEDQFDDSFESKPIHESIVHSFPVYQP